ncbi:hypothetical protein Tco_1142155, partial [Tanacetum coccineum]
PHCYHSAAYQNLGVLHIVKERFLKQKAKVKWLKSGDANSAYFHKVVKSHVSRNRIDSVITSSGACVDGDQVPIAFIDHYTAFLGQQGVSIPLLNNILFCTKLSTVMADYMIRAMSDEEIRDAIFSMGDDKSPGPDGFFEFFINGVLLKELNHTIIALIPKVATPLKINDYRPISCCNVLFKCISMIISLRMKDSLLELLMHIYHLDRGPPRCAFKVDIQKAYDTVNWAFLKVVLIGFGFHPRKRGLQKGDPMSPYLFTLVMEVLTLMLHRRVRESDLVLIIGEMRNGKVLERVEGAIGIPNMPSTLDLIVEFLIPLAKKRSASREIWQREKVLDVAWKLYVHSWSEECQLRVVLLFSSPSFALCGMSLAFSGCSSLA